MSTAQHHGLIKAPALNHVFPHDTLPIEECLGRRLAVDVFSLVPLPPFTDSAMDGLAARHEDLEGEGPWALPVVGDIPADGTCESHLEKGQAWRIMTGVPIPEGTDTVVEIECTDHVTDVARAPDSVEIRVTPKLDTSVRVVGEALKADPPVLEAGRILDETALSATAPVRHDTLMVLPRPCVIVVSTGAELKRAGKALERRQIPDSNGILSCGLVEEADGQIVTHLRTGDTPAELRRTLDEVPEVDLVPTAGGISAGVFEVMRLTLGTDVGFHHVTQQSSGPRGADSTQVGAGGRETPVIYLLGNPASVFTTFRIYVAGALAIISGLVAPEHGGTVFSGVIARTCVGQDCSSGKTQFIPFRFVDVPGDETRARRVEPVHPLGSKLHLVTSLMNVKTIGVVAPDVEVVEPNQGLAVIPLVD